MAAADLNSVRATIEARLATELANSPAIPVIFHNMAHEPTPNSSWVQLNNVKVNEYLSQGLTTNSQNRILGLLVMNIFTAKGVGPGANYTIGKRIRDLYNRDYRHWGRRRSQRSRGLASPAPEGYFQTQVQQDLEFIEEL